MKTLVEQAFFGWLILVCAGFALAGAGSFRRAPFWLQRGDGSQLTTQAVDAHQPGDFRTVELDQRLRAGLHAFIYLHKPGYNPAADGLIGCSGTDYLQHRIAECEELPERYRDFTVLVAEYHGSIRKIGFYVPCGSRVSLHDEVQPITGVALTSRRVERFPVNVLAFPSLESVLYSHADEHAAMVAQRHAARNTPSAPSSSSTTALHVNPTKEVTV